MAKDEKRINLTKQELLEKERELLGFNLTSIIGENKLKIDHNGFVGIRNINEALSSQQEAKNMLVAAVITKLEYKQSKAGNFFYWIHITDDWMSTKLFCNMRTFQEYSYELIKGACVLFNINIKNDFVTFDKCKNVERLPLKKDLIFVIELPYGQWTTKIQEFISEQVDRTIRRGNCEVYLRTRPCEIFIDPTYELIDSIKKLFNVNCSIKNIDEYVWPNSTKLIKKMEENGY